MYNKDAGVALIDELKRHERVSSFVPLNIEGVDTGMAFWGFREYVNGFSLSTLQ